MERAESEHQSRFASAKTLLRFVVFIGLAAIHGSAQTTRFTSQAITEYATVNGTTTNVDELTEPNGTLIDPCQRFGDLSVDSQACLGCGGGDGNGLHLVTIVRDLIGQVIARVTKDE
jgi:hypothetical protein